MNDSQTSDTETDETDACQEWEIGIRAWGPDDSPGEARWEHYHPVASTEEAAVKKAQQEARRGLNSLVGMQDVCEVFMIEGPFKLNDE